MKQVKLENDELSKECYRQLKEITCLHHTIYTLSHTITGIIFYII